MTESQSPQDGSFAAPRNGVPAGTEPYSGSYLDSPVETEADTATTSTAGYQGGASGSGTVDNSGSGTVDAAKQEAAGVASTAKDAAGGVVDTAKGEAANVAQEVKLNARQLLTQTKGELTDQAATQQQRVAEGLRSISDELSTMAGASNNGGVAADLVQQAADRSSSVAQWLENRDPGSLLNEVKSFARRRPGAFLLLAAGAGVLAGRLGRGMADNASAESTGATATSAPRPSTTRAPAAQCRHPPSTSRVRMPPRQTTAPRPPRATAPPPESRLPAELQEQPATEPVVTTPELPVGWRAPRPPTRKPMVEPRRRVTRWPDRWIPMTPPMEVPDDQSR